MREIKFRAWIKDRKIMVPVETFCISENRVIYHGGMRSEEFKLMQYTDFKDKNGKEIYEEDILKTQWGMEIVGWDFEKLHRLNIFKDAIEIIGNIYENPKFLEK